MTDTRTKLRGFVGGMEEAPDGWQLAHIESCESRDRSSLAHGSEYKDQIFYRIRVRGDTQDMELEVQCRAWAWRDRKDQMYIAGLLSRNGQTVPYWAVINLKSRTGHLRLSSENFEKIGLKPEPISPF